MGKNAPYVDRLPTVEGQEDWSHGRKVGDSGTHCLHALP